LGCIIVVAFVLGHYAKTWKYMYVGIFAEILFDLKKIVNPSSEIPSKIPQRRECELAGNSEKVRSPTQLRETHYRQKGYLRESARNWGHSAKVSFYSGILTAKFFDCGVSLGALSRTF
jgi:hypothetical protein